MAKDQFPSSILFYDGECGLCAHSVKLALRLEKNRSLSFAPLQGKTAQQLLPPELLTQLSTLVFWREGKIFTRSQAVALMLQQIGHPYLSRVIKFIPLSWRDTVYAFIAKNRHNWFANSSCALPVDHHGPRFLS